MKIGLAGKLYTLYRLGWRNLLRVFLYRGQKKLGLLKHRLPIRQVISGPFFSEKTDSGDLVWDPVYFSFHRFGALHCPQWFFDPFAQREFPLSQVHWCEIPDFIQDSGDIKIIWELSRFDWCVYFSLQFKKTNDERWLALLEEWLRSWCLANPTNRGPNWKCGQEASIRVFHLISAHRILGIGKFSDGFRELLKQHLERIESTLSYAMGQDNNHGTSEAAGLFVGGAWLSWQMGNDKDSLRWKRLGRMWLEERIQHLIEDDGTFSQYSVNYHRLVLDTLSHVEMIRRATGEKSFSKGFYSRVQKARVWLNSMVDDVSGDAPNLGANDGARLFPVPDTDYRDFRPTLGRMEEFFSTAEGNEVRDRKPPFDFFTQSSTRLPSPPKSALCLKGGFAVMRFPQVVLVCRFPRFRFRPSHADGLHVDLWWKGQNWLRDGGSYSYNADPRWLSYFSGTASHNTIQFDNQDQMPRMSRFLFSDWTSGKVHDWKCDDESATFSCSYVDLCGNEHQRTIMADVRRIRIVDEICGGFSEAVARWRLLPGKWQVFADGMALDGVSIKFQAEKPVQIQQEKGWESRYYLHMNEIPVMAVRSKSSNTLTTEITLG